MSLAKNNNDVELPSFTKQAKNFPRQLPVHSRMPRNIERKIFERHDFTHFPALPPNLPIQGFPPFQGIPGFHSEPISGPIHAPDPGPMLLPMSGPMLEPMPGFNPMSIPMPTPMQSQRNKHPVIVYHQKLRSPKKKKSRHPHHTTGDTSNKSEDSSDSTGSEDFDRWNRNKKKKMKKDEIIRRYNSHHDHHHNGYRKQHHHHREKTKKNTELLTPMLQYVTKDGYVIFEKKISKKEANDWLASKEQPKINKEELVVKTDTELLQKRKQKIKTKAINIDDIMKIKEKDSLERSAELNAIKELHTKQPRKKYKRKKMYDHSSDLGHNSS